VGESSPFFFKQEEGHEGAVGIILFPMRKSLDDIRDEIVQVNTAAQKLCAGLTEEQLAWRPQAGRWSIAENLVHLNLTTQIFLPSVDRTIETSDRNAYVQGPFELGVLGRLFVWYVEPPPKVRAPAPKPITPILEGRAVDALPQFLRSQKAAVDRVDAAEGLDCSKIKFRYPLSGLVKMNLITFFAVMTGHQRRHLAQAEKIRAEMKI
jgi:hypothetical protein